MPLLDERKTEQINGTVYDMSPSADYRHATININILGVLKQMLKGSLCMVFCENLDFVLDEQGNYAIPDVMIICDRKQLNKGKYHGIPKFIVETLSPSTASRDRKEKKALYAAKGVDEYWIIDPFSKSIEIYYLTEGNYELEETYILETDEDDAAYNADVVITLKAFPNVTVALVDIFENV